MKRDKIGFNIIPFYSFPIPYPVIFNDRRNKRFNEWIFGIVYIRERKSFFYLFKNDPSKIDKNVSVKKKEDGKVETQRYELKSGR